MDLYKENSENIWIKLEKKGTKVYLKANFNLKVQIVINELT